MAGIVETILDTVRSSAVGAAARFVGKKIDDYVTEQLENADWQKAQRIMREQIEKRDTRKEVPPPKRNVIHIKVTRADGK